MKRELVNGIHDTLHYVSSKVVGMRSSSHDGLAICGECGLRALGSDERRMVTNCGYK